MTKLKLIRVTAAVVTGLSFGAGVGVAGASSNHGGWGSDSKKGNSHVVENNNEVGVNNTNNQVATSGEATVGGGDKHKSHWNDSDDDESNVLGDAKTGDAMNENKTNIGVTVANTDDGCGCVPVDGEEGSSSNSSKITNNNSVGINNVSNQTATSGNASVKGNGNGGSATTGNASNKNDTTISVGVSNN